MAFRGSTTIPSTSSSLLYIFISPSSANSSHTPSSGPTDILAYLSCSNVVLSISCPRRWFTRSDCKIDSSFRLFYHLCKKADISNISQDSSIDNLIKLLNLNHSPLFSTQKIVRFRGYLSLISKKEKEKTYPYILSSFNKVLQLILRLKFTLQSI